MKGDAAMTQGMIVWVLLMGLAGHIWVIALGILDDYHHSRDKRRGCASPEPRDGNEPHDAHPESQGLRPGKAA